MNFESIVAVGPPLDRLMDPNVLTRPMSWDVWFLRTMVIEAQRRERVIEGRVDPTPFEPWKVCDPGELKAWRKKHADSPKCVLNMKFSTGKDSYGLRGISGSVATLDKK